MVPDAVKVITRTKKRPREENKSKSIRSTETPHQPAISGSVKKLNTNRPKRKVHTRSAQNEVENPIMKLTDCFVKLNRLTEAQIMDAHRNPVSSKNSHSSNNNADANANAKDGKNSTVSKYSFIVHSMQTFHVFFLIVQGQNASIGTQTRAMKRKRSEINMKPNNSMSPKKVQNKTHSRARTRTRKLTLAQAIENGSPSNEFVTDEVVLVTIPGFCAWPARIVGILGETLMVEFFGTSQINPVRINAVTRFKLIDVIPLLQRKGFRKSMEELEFALQIPPQISLFKQ